MRDAILCAIAAATLLGCTLSPPRASVPDEKVYYRISRPAHARLVLDAIEEHLNETGARRIAVVAVGGGVRFLVAGEVDRKGEPYAPTVRRLAERGVDFIACGNSLEDLKIDPAKLVGLGRLVASVDEESRRLRAEGFVELR